MNNGIYKFSLCEDASLVYVGINKHDREDISHGQGKTGRRS